MLAGSFSSNFYGLPRATEDADFVIETAGSQLADALASLPAEFKPERQLHLETVTGTTYSVVVVAETEFTIELFRLGNDPHDQERFRRRVRKTLLNCEVYLPMAEDVIVTKLRWLKLARRNKDRDDVRDIIAVRADRIDWQYVHRWCDEHGTRPLLDEIRASIPPL